LSKNSRRSPFAVMPLRTKGAAVLTSAILACMASITACLAENTAPHPKLTKSALLGCWEKNIARTSWRGFRTGISPKRGRT
jgi:hypothetical protein